MGKKMYLVFDTEVTNLCGEDGKNLDTSSGQVYDYGGVVVDDCGRAYDSFSFVNEDVFFSDQMGSAYYKDKISTYKEELRQGTRILVDTLDIYFYTRRIIKKYNVSAVCAYNARFDVECLNATIRYQTKSRIRYFFPYSLSIIDILKLAREHIGRTKDYTEFCDSNGYKTKHKVPQNRMTAEIVYRFLSGNNSFKESHTGFSDSNIESSIFIYCLNKKFKEGVQISFGV